MEPPKKLPIHVAEKISQRVDKPRQFTTATIASKMEEPEANAFIEQVSHSTEDPIAIHQKYEQERKASLPLWVSFEGSLKKRIDSAAIKEGIPSRDLVHTMVEEWLIKNGF
jgi:hypothetical protein